MAEKFIELNSINGNLKMFIIQAIKNTIGLRGISFEENHYFKIQEREISGYKYMEITHFQTKIGFEQKYYYECKEKWEGILKVNICEINDK